MPRKKTLKQTQSEEMPSSVQKKKRSVTKKRSTVKVTRKISGVKTSSTVSPRNGFQIRIDHPSDGEIIGRQHYAVRISCSCTVPGGVEISIDGSEYLSAREAVGFWWYDWCDIPEGEHRIVARALAEDGSVMGISSIIKITAR